MLVGILLRLAGVITLPNVLIAVIGMIGVFLLATWQLRRPVSWQLPRRRDHN